MTATTPPEGEIDAVLCRLTTGYTRKELLSFSEEDTGLDKYEVADELKSVDRAKAALSRLIEQARLDELQRYKADYQSNPGHDWNYIDRRIAELEAGSGEAAE